MKVGFASEKPKKLTFLFGFSLDLHYLCIGKVGNGPTEPFTEQNNMNKETKYLVDKITDAIQDKKGRGIVVADLSEIGTAVCSCFVICEGRTPTQVEAIAESVGDKLRIEDGLKPIHVEGLRNALWVAIDYVDVMVHIFVPEDRQYYNLENLWADAELTSVPDLD